MAKSATSIEPEVLDELNRLGAERGPIADWLEGLEARRAEVSPTVYRRVREDYATRIADIDRRSRPLRVQATRTIALFDEQLARLATEKGEVEFDLQELELRHRLDEYSDAELDERAKGPRQRIEELGLELEKLRATRELWLAARGEELDEAAAPEPASAPKATPAAGATAAVSVAPAPPAHTAPTTPTPPPAATPPVAPTVRLAPMPPAPGGVEPNPVEITLPHSIPPPRPSSAAIPLPHAPGAPARPAQVSSPAPAAPAPPTPVASIDPPPLDRTVIYTPEPPSPVSDGGEGGDAGAAAGSTHRLQAKLVPVDGGEAAAGHLLAEVNTIGRVAENSLQIQQGSVSRHHAILRFTAEGWTLEDLEAENGTWVNGERIEQRRLLDGDRVNIGTVRFLFRIG